VILTPGQLYFINEQDVKTGTRSNYYKIGIVRDADDRDSKNRLLEHQTGNPRKLCIVEALSMPAVEAVETNLHYLFARNRVMGEWMHFTDSELRSAIKKAKDLAAEMLANIEDYITADVLKKTISNGSKLPATEDAEEWYVQIQDHKEVLEACDAVLEQYDDYLIEAIEKGIDVSGRASVQTRAGARRFDEKMFAIKYPDLFKKFSTSTKSIKGSFRVKPDKEWIPDLGVIDEGQVELIASFGDLLANAEHSLEAGFALHEKHLGVLEIRKYAEWKIDVANVKLRVLTGAYEGIDEICTWKREEKETITLDKTALQSQYPDAYNDCLIQGAETTALIVEPKIPQV
jgi:hypothetical protein